MVWYSLSNDLREMNIINESSEGKNYYCHKKKSKAHFISMELHQEPHSTKSWDKTQLEECKLKVDKGSGQCIHWNHYGGS